MRGHVGNYSTHKGSCWELFHTLRGHVGNYSTHQGVLLGITPHMRGSGCELLHTCMSGCGKLFHTWHQKCDVQQLDGFLAWCLFACATWQLCDDVCSDWLRIAMPAALGRDNFQSKHGGSRCQAQQCEPNEWHCDVQVCKQLTPKCKNTFTHVLEMHLDITLSMHWTMPKLLQKHNSSIPRCGIAIVSDVQVAFSSCTLNVKLWSTERRQ